MAAVELSWLSESDTFDDQYRNIDLNRMKTIAESRNVDASSDHWHSSCSILAMSSNCWWGFVFDNSGLLIN